MFFKTWFYVSLYVRCYRRCYGGTAGRQASDAAFESSGSCEPQHASEPLLRLPSPIQGRLYVLCRLGNVAVPQVSLDIRQRGVEGGEKRCVGGAQTVAGDVSET